MEKYTVMVDEAKTVCWFKYETGKRHRINGPAIEYNNGSKEWWIDGKLHRTDGPAVERENGTKEWWINGKLHRTDGPAIEWSNGSKEWYVNGKELTREEFEKRTVPSCDGKIVKIDGKKYRLTEVR